MAEATPGKIKKETPSALVEITFCGKELRDVDTFSKTDAQCVMFMKEAWQTDWKEVGRTEIIWNSLNPKWVKKTIIEYYFEEKQEVKIDVYDADKETQDIRKHTLIGEVQATLGTIVSSVVLEKEIRGAGKYTGKRCGNLIISAEQCQDCRESALLQWKATSLDKKDFIGSSDPFLVFSKKAHDGRYVQVHKTEVIKNNLNPTWKEFTISVGSLCNGNYDREIQVECYDWNRNGSHKLIGQFFTKMRTITVGIGSANTYELINPNPKPSKSSKKKANAGTVSLVLCKISSENTFLDYLQGGTEVHVSVAIDFTSSNGDPRDPKSLHYIGSREPTIYARAIQAVGDIVQDYNRDKLIYAIGFGAIQPGSNEAKDEFPLNANPRNPYCNGVDGVLSSYMSTLNAVQLHGPTNFAPFINSVAKLATKKTDGSTYHILLILTDGIVSDMEQTVSATVEDFWIYRN